MSVEKILEISKSGIVLIETEKGLRVSYETPKNPRELTQRRKEAVIYLMASAVKYSQGGFDR